MTSRAIIVIATNLPPWWAEVSRPRMEHYAARCKAELVVLEPEWRGMMTRTVCAEHVMRYRRSLVLDADVVISREAPDIFDAHPSGAVWMASDSAPEDPLAHRQLQLIVSIQAMTGHCYWTSGYGNSGVVLCDWDHNDLWRGWHDFPAQWCPDQCNINMRVRKTARGHALLGREWNSFGLNSPNVAEYLVTVDTATGERRSIVRPDPAGLGYNHMSRIQDICHGAYIAHAAGFAEPQRSEAIRQMDKLLP